MISRKVPRKRKGAMKSGVGGKLISKCKEISIHFVAPAEGRFAPLREIFFALCVKSHPQKFPINYLKFL